MTNEDRTMLTFAEAATYTGMTEAWLRRAVFNKRIPFHKFGDYRNAPIRFAKDDLDLWLESNRVEAAQ